MSRSYTTKTINSNLSSKEENAKSALRIFDYTPLAISMQDKEGNRPFFEEQCITVTPGKINAITKNACKIMNGGGKGDPIVTAFDTQTRAPIINPIDYFENIENFTPVLWGNLRGSKGIMQTLDFLGKDYLQIDHAYFGRGHDKMNYRVSISSRFAGKPQWILGDRMNDLKNKYFKDQPFLMPWRKNGSHILICPPSKNSLLMRGSGEWLDIVTYTLRQHTDRPLKVKQKNVDDSSGFLDAWAVVTEESNVAIDAYNLGIPVFSLKPDIYSYCGNTDLKEIETPLIGDRTVLFNWLSYNQFHINEMKSGEAISILRDIYG